ncbi:MAG: RNA-binding protein [Clostridia bacterium]
MSVKDYLLGRYPGDENKIFIGRMMEYLDRCDKKQQKLFTDFLHPLQVKMACEMARSYNAVSLSLHGGFKDCERRIAAIFPEWDHVVPEEFPIVVLKITDRGWGRALSHRDFLGALLGLGIKREKVGDLLVRDKNCFAAVHRDIAGFVEANLGRAGRSTLLVQRAAGEDLNIAPEYDKKRITVASPRLDSVVSAVFGLSRAKSAGLINGEKVKVNWEVCTRTDNVLQQGDIVSAGGKGKFKVEEFSGVTKKGRSVMVIKKYI